MGALPVLIFVSLTIEKVYALYSLQSFHALKSKIVRRPILETSFLHMP